MQIQMMMAAISAGELKTDTNPGVLLDLLTDRSSMAPGHARVNKAFVKAVLGCVLKPLSSDLEMQAGVDKSRERDCPRERRAAQNILSEL